MKQIFNNRYLECIRFGSTQELKQYWAAQDIRKISIDEMSGEFLQCYIIRNGLTESKEGVIFFSSDIDVDKLIVLFYGNDFVVLENGKSIYMIDFNLAIRWVIEISSPLISLFVTKVQNLLILEEGSVREINYLGKVLQSKLLDLVENHHLENDILTLETESSVVKYKLIE
jgi:hypothetical protein